MPGKRMRQLIKQEPGESCAEQVQGDERMEGDDDDDHRSPEVCDVDARGEELQAQLLRANVEVQAAALLGIEQMRESREELAVANGAVALLQEDARAKDAEVRSALRSSSALEVRVASLESALRAKCQQLEECSLQLERLAREVDAKDALIRRLQAEAQRGVKTEPRDDDVKPGVAAAALVAPADSGSSSGLQRPARCVRANGPGFINMFGSEGKAKGKLKYPQKIIIDADGNYIVADAGNGRIQVFRSSDCACLRIIGKAGSEAGQFNYPSGVALDGSGLLIVADQYNHRVQVLRYADGSHVRTIGCMGSAPGEFKFPDSVVVDGNGHLLVHDALNGRIQVFNLADGSYMRSLCSEGSDPGQLRGSGRIVFDAAHNVVVADGGNHRLQVIRYSDGAFLRSIGSEGTGAGEFKCPIGIALDDTGNIIVADWDNHRVQVLRYADGSHVRTIGCMGSAPGEFNGPRAIAIDASGRIITTDSCNHRVQILQ